MARDFRLKKSYNSIYFDQVVKQTRFWNLKIMNANFIAFQKIGVPNWATLPYLSRWRTVKSLLPNLQSGFVLYEKYYWKMAKIVENNDVS